MHYCYRGGEKGDAAPADANSETGWGKNLSILHDRDIFLSAILAGGISSALDEDP